MTQIVHPGAALTPRVLAVPCHARQVAVTLPAGMTILDAFTAALQPLGIDSAVVEFHDATFAPLVYVIPALGDDGVHPAWYSDLRRPDGECHLQQMVATYGLRDGAPFLHGHGFWRHADGPRHGGHIIPTEAVLARPVQARVLAISGAIFEQTEDSETCFTLFQPRPHDGAVDGNRALALRLRPHVEFSGAIEDAARQHGITNARLYGLGSFIDCDFEGGHRMKSIASEFFIHNGQLTNGRLSVDLGIVDIHGLLHEGVILHGANRVCVTCELLLVEGAG